MMTAAQFKKRSNIFMHRRKSPIIKDIDKLLKEYEKSGSENRKMKCLVYVYMMCKQYLFTKPTGRRGDAVQALIDEVRGVLDSPHFKQQISAKAGGRHYSGGQEKNVMSTAGSSATSLAQGYTWEGILPQKNFVEKMRLNMNDILGSDQKYFGASMVSQAVESNLQMKGVSSDQSAHQAHQMIAKMPFSQVLDWLHGLWTGIDKGNFNYLNAEQRLDYLLLIKNGRLYNYSKNAAFDSGTGFSGPNSVAYAMDTDERLFSTGDVKGVGVDWNHSSLLSGHAVICAGEIKVQQGRLLEIDNNSGHYKPDTQNLSDCVKSLIQAGLDPQTFRVSDKSKGRDYNTGSAFLAANP